MFEAKHQARCSVHWMLCAIHCRKELATGKDTSKPQDVTIRAAIIKAGQAESNILPSHVPSDDTVLCNISSVNRIYETPGQR